MISSNSPVYFLIVSTIVYISNHLPDMHTAIGRNDEGLWYVLFSGQDEWMDVEIAEDKTVSIGCHDSLNALAEELVNFLSGSRGLLN